MSGPPRIIFPPFTYQPPPPPVSARDLIRANIDSLSWGWESRRYKFTEDDTIVGRKSTQRTTTKKKRKKASNKNTGDDWSWIGNSWTTSRIDSESTMSQIVHLSFVAVRTIRGHLMSSDGPLWFSWQFLQFSAEACVAFTPSHSCWRESLQWKILKKCLPMGTSVLLSVQSAYIGLCC